MPTKNTSLLLIIPLVMAVFGVADAGFFFQAAVPGSCILILAFIYRNSLKSFPDTWFIIAAFLFSIAGDWFLSNKGDSFFRFSFGIGLYLIAHVGYLWFALKNGGIHRLFTAVFLAGFLLFFLLGIMPNIDDTVLMLAVLLYLLISCVSLGAAFGTHLSPMVKWLYFLGIALVVFSDTIIALKEFMGHQELDFLISPTYYAAHISITMSLIKRATGSV